LENQSDDQEKMNEDSVHNALVNDNFFKF
jgi:hypothetical protein